MSRGDYLRDAFEYLRAAPGFHQGGFVPHSDIKDPPWGFNPGRPPAVEIISDPADQRGLAARPARVPQ